MSRKEIILITGSNGEIGNNLINFLSRKTSQNIVSLDLQPAKDESHVYKHLVGSILDTQLVNDINAEFEISEIYHLAAMLSTKSEYAPFSANQVNVDGTLKMIDLAIKQAISKNKAVKFFFPSSIAVYGTNSTKNTVNEQECLNPKTIYGMNKLYCEQLGDYFSKDYHRLGKDYQPGLLDFRSIRFPGIISVTTQPSGGTSDYLPDMLHAAGRLEKKYISFVNAKSRLPFMVMPDAIEAIFKLMNAQRDYLKHHVYNISAFSPSVEEFHTKILDFYPNFEVDYNVNEQRQSMVDGWPDEVCCKRALHDWNWQPKYDLNSAFAEYFIPFLKSVRI